MPDKSLIRAEFLKKRAALSLADKTKNSQLILDKLETMKEFVSAEKICIYLAKGDEVQTENFIKKYLASKRFFLPKINTPTNQLEIHEFSDFKKLQPGPFNTLESNEGTIISPAEMDIIIVPGVVFDLSGHRLGYGKGFYDRFLKEIKAPKIGMSFDLQIVAKLPANDYDVAVDRIVTESRVIMCKK